MNKRPQNVPAPDAHRSAYGNGKSAPPAKSSTARRRRARKRAVRREIASWILTLVLAAVLALGVRAYVFEIVRVEGPSMEPTLQSGEMLCVTKFDYIFSAPARGDVVVCRYPAESDYGPVLIGNGQYLVMGDNRAVSHDSRADDVGTLKADYIIGHARSVVYPLSDIHGI